MIGFHLHTQASIGTSSLFPLGWACQFRAAEASVTEKCTGAVEKGQGRSRPKGKSVFVQTVFSTEFAAGKLSRDVESSI